MSKKYLCLFEMGQSVERTLDVVLTTFNDHSTEVNGQAKVCDREAGVVRRFDTLSYDTLSIDELRFDTSIFDQLTPPPYNLLLKND